MMRLNAFWMCFWSSTTSYSLIYSNKLLDNSKPFISWYSKAFFCFSTRLLSCLCNYFLLSSPLVSLGYFHVYAIIFFTHLRTRFLFMVVFAFYQVKILEWILFTFTGSIRYNMQQQQQPSTVSLTGKTLMHKHNCHPRQVSAVCTGLSEMTLSACTGFLLQDFL